MPTYQIRVTAPVANLQPNGTGTRTRAGHTFGRAWTVLDDPPSAVLEDSCLECRLLDGDAASVSEAELSRVPMPELEEVLAAYSVRCRELEEQLAEQSASEAKLRAELATSLERCAALQGELEGARAEFIQLPAEEAAQRVDELEAELSSAKALLAECTSELGAARKALLAPAKKGKG